VILTEDQVRALIDQTTAVPGAAVTVDLTTNEVVAPDGQRFGFEIESDVRERLLNGWDDISLTLANEAAITAYEQSREREGPVTTLFA
jgi:3-isopropylmalate/(R)-2-methylmalate dehydratase small subunit